MNDPDISEIINELGEDRNQYFNAVTPPVFQTSNFVFNTMDEFRKVLKGESPAYLYTNKNNPTVDILATKIAALEHAEKCLVVNGGTAAIYTSVLPQVKSGDHIISIENPYNWAHKLFVNILPRFNVTTTFVDGRDISNIEKAIRPETKLIYLESPNSWTFHLQDLEAIARLAKEKNIITICDNSYASPLYQQPLSMGIDITIHSATKYLNGHSDVIAGVICGSEKMINKITLGEFLNIGVGIKPFDAWLILRGLRTLPARMERISRTAEKVVSYLKAKNEIESISYPFDKDFPQYDLARKQMTGSGGLFSFIIKAKSPDTIRKFCEAARHILLAISWGGHESLIVPSVAFMDPENFDANNPEHRRIRLYTGLEDADYIIQDLERSFKVIQ